MTASESFVSRALRCSIFDVMFFSLMVGLGETYLVAYALALGLGEAQAGLVGVVPMLFGAVVQLFAGYGVRAFHSRRRWICFCAMLQAAALIGLAQLPRWNLKGELLTSTVFAIACVYWASGLSAGPTWNTWIAKIVPLNQRLKFFATRARAAQLFVLIGLVTAGLLLENSRASASELRTFSWLFSIAGLMRLVSGYFIFVQDDCGSRADIIDRVQQNKLMLGFSLTTMNRSVSLMIIYLFLVNLAVYVSGPFFSPYMLKQLNLDFFEYTILISASFLARVVANDFFVFIARTRGVKSLLYFGLLGIVPLPMLWAFSDSFTYLLVLQIISGCVWGSHELGVTLFILESYEEHQRSMVLTIANLFNSVAMFLGGILGAQILVNGMINLEAYHQVFYSSTALRVVPLLLLFSMGSMRVKSSIRRMYTRILSVRPGGALITKPILYTGAEANDEAGPAK